MLINENARLGGALKLQRWLDAFACDIASLSNDDDKIKIASKAEELLNLLNDAYCGEDLFYANFDLTDKTSDDLNLLSLDATDHQDFDAPELVDSQQKSFHFQEDELNDFAESISSRDSELVDDFEGDRVIDDAVDIALNQDVDSSHESDAISDSESASALLTGYLESDFSETDDNVKGLYVGVIEDSRENNIIEEETDDENVSVDSDESISDDEAHESYDDVVEPEVDENNYGSDDFDDSNVFDDDVEINTEDSVESKRMEDMTDDEESENQALSDDFDLDNIPGLPTASDVSDYIQD